MSEKYKAALAAVNNGGIVKCDGEACVVIDKSGRVIVIKN